MLEDYLTVSGHARTEGTAIKAASGWDKNGNGTAAYGWLGLSSGYRAGYGNFASIGYVGSKSHIKLVLVYIFHPNKSY